MKTRADRIHIVDLELSAHIGVTAEERAHPQRLSVSITMEPARPFSELEDDFAKATDYFDACQTILAIARQRPRQLIETLAEEIATALLARHAIATVKVELRKYIIAGARHVSVEIQRQQPAL